MRIHINNKGKNKSLGKYSFRVVTFIVLVVVFVMGSALARELYREYKIQKDIEALKVQISDMEKDNYELAQFIEYLKTDESKEAEARKRLNLKADGEKVVMIDEASQSNVVTQPNAAAAEENVSNYRKWWNYFFVNKG